MNKTIDLHTHTNASDGTYSPEALIDYAIQKGLSAIAVTDHDTIDGIDRAIKRAADHPSLEVIPGIEFSTHSDICKSDLHILGYYIDTNDTTFVNALKAIVDSRIHRNEKMIHKMQGAGLNITLEDVTSLSEDGVITRAHFAKAMENLGIVNRMSHAFDRYIGDGKPYYIEREKVTPKMAIDMIIDNGGVPVLAHPVLYDLSLKKLEALLRELITYGLVGVEGIYTTYKTHETNYMAKMAADLNLINTGGSDFHGAIKPGIDLGTGFGPLAVPYAIRDAVYKAHIKIKGHGL